VTHPADADNIPFGVNTEVPSPARMYDYFLGGKWNYEIDRQAAEAGLAVAGPVVRDMAVSNRAFLIAATRYLAQQGVAQYLDIGSGLPTQENVHEVVRAVNPQACTVYVDNDPSVRAMSQAIIVGHPNTHYTEGDLRDPQSILSNPEVLRSLDFSQPMALLLVAVLHFVPDSYDPVGLIGRYVEALPSGSYVVISHISRTGMDADLYEVLEATNKNLAVPIAYRSREEIAGLLDLPSLEVLKPGLVDVQAWAPGEELAFSPSRQRLFGAVARKR
jgi:hypothetical protein